MKKSSLIFSLWAIVAVTVFSSCQKDDNPAPVSRVSFLGISNGSTVEVEDGKSTSIKWVANKGGASMKEFRVLKDGAMYGEYNGGSVKTLSGSLRDTYQDSIVVFGSLPGNYVFRVTDNDGITGEASVKVVKKNNATVLDAQKTFEWKRIGAAEGTGLDMFGLKWDSNSKTNVIIKANADKLVILPSSEWSNITTKEALKAKIDAAPGVTQYTGVSASASGSYSDVIATKKGAEYFILKVTKGAVSYNTTIGTTITINGNYKK